MKKITVKELKTFINDEIEKKRENISLYEKVEFILKHFEGKKISKRIVTKFQKVYPDFDCYLSHEYSMYYLCIKKKETKEFKKFLIGYESENIVSVKPIENVTRGFEYFSNCYGGAERECIDQAYELFFDDEKLNKIVTVYNNYLLSLIEINKIKNINAFSINTKIFKFMGLDLGKIQYISEREIEEFEK